MSDEYEIENDSRCVKVDNSGLKPALKAVGAYARHIAEFAGYSDRESIECIFKEFESLKGAIEDLRRADIMSNDHISDLFRSLLLEIMDDDCDDELD